MAFTAATSQALVQTVLDKLDAAYQLHEQYMLVNNPGLLAANITALNAVVTAINAVQA